ncbi:recombinase family protein [Brevibacterium gallinarum]|uniref:Recombinase family protein n=1 Tax=Brevibacterium gallinarum TaxID=2762220 RepID=A0ABR8WY16_9MICO|nr:recombinase family protein [Brevibacterium gallinarum]MBD8021762.1 recombinase family protein [Brevibacterium gallinarum]
MRAFIYTRYAEPNPAQRHRQYEQCKTLAEQRRYQVIGTAHDDSHHRSGLATLIEGLRARDIDIVLITDYACLGPTITSLAAMMDEIDRADARLLACAEPLLPPTILDMLLMLVRRQGLSGEIESS